VFPYAAKKHTPAAVMKNQIPDAVKKQRVAELTRLSDELYNSYVRQFAGNSGKVLFEIHRDGFLQGHNSEYVLVRVKSDDISLLHQMKDVKYQDVNDDYLLGELL